MYIYLTWTKPISAWQHIWFIADIYWEFSTGILLASIANSQSQPKITMQKGACIPCQLYLFWTLPKETFVYLCEFNLSFMQTREGVMGRGGTWDRQTKKRREYFLGIKKKILIYYYYDIFESYNESVYMRDDMQREIWFAF